MCSFCGSPIARDPKPGFNEVCVDCGRDLHCCRNCRFYKPGIHWDCAESAIQDRVAEKDKRNFCDWFEVNPAFFTRTQGSPAQRDAAQKARDELNKLFGG